MLDAERIGLFVPGELPLQKLAIKPGLLVYASPHNPGATAVAADLAAGMQGVVVSSERPLSATHFLLYLNGQTYEGENGPPDFVYAIIWSELVFFFSFGGVQLWQQCVRPSRYWRGEVAYQLLSLLAKGVLGSILIFNVLMLSNFDEIFEQQD